MPTIAYSLKRTVAPTVEPVGLLEVKEHVRVQHNEDDQYLRNLITTAREELEARTRRAFINSTWALKLNDWPDEEYISIPIAPLSSVTSIQYIDGDGNTQTWASSNYEVDTNREPGVIWLAYDKSFPTLRSIQNAVAITFVSGYGAAATSVPLRAKQAMLLWIETKYTTRGVHDDTQFATLANKAYESLVESLSHGEYP